MDNVLSNDVKMWTIDSKSVQGMDSKKGASVSRTIVLSVCTQESYLWYASNRWLAVRAVDCPLGIGMDRWLDFLKLPQESWSAGRVSSRGAPSLALPQEPTPSIYTQVEKISLSLQKLGRVMKGPQ